MFLQECVILSTGGVPDQVHPPGPGTPPPPDQVPPPDQTRYTPQTGTPPTAHSMLGDTVNARAVRILLECIIVNSTVCSILEDEILSDR